MMQSQKCISNSSSFSPPELSGILLYKIQFRIWAWVRKFVGCAACMLWG